MPFIEQLGQQMLSSGVAQAQGGIFGALFGRGADRRQRQQAEKLQKLQMQGQKEMTDYNLMKQLEMWEKTGYGAQVDQLKKAGLNPGLIYGMGGGAGGSTNVDTGNVAASGATRSNPESIISSGMGLNLALMQAQKENIEADTANKKADTANKPLTGANVAADTRLKNLEAAFQRTTFNDRADEIYYEAQGEMYKTGIMEQTEGQIKDQRPDILLKLKAEREKIQTEAIGALLANDQTKEQTKLTTEQIEKVKSEIAVNAATIQKWVAEVSQGWERLSYEERKTKVSELAQSIEGERFDWEKIDRTWNKVMDVMSLGRRGKK